jgi:hypothetical protein
LGCDEALTGRVISSVFESSETVAQDLADVPSVLLTKVRAVSEDSYVIAVDMW